MFPFDSPIERRDTECVKFEQREAKFGSAEVLPLWVADMDLAVPPCVLEAIEERATHPVYGYTIYSKRFFSAIAGWMEKRHGWPIEPGSIVPLSGVVPALNFLVTALSAPGDAILIQTPVYHPFFRLGKHHGRELLYNPLIEGQEGYRIDFDDFRKKAKAAKLFILCSPHNPVGRVWKREELEAMAEICLQEKVLVVSDEIHADIVYAPHKHTPMATIHGDISQRCITLNAPSKTFNIAALGTAYAIIENDSLRRSVTAELRRYDAVSANPFGTQALMAAYEGGEPWLEALLDYLQGNLDYLYGELATLHPAIRPVIPEATYLLWLDCKALGLNDKALERFFVQEARLGLNSGISFGQEGSGFMRLNFATPRAALHRAMEQLRTALQTL